METLLLLDQLPNQIHQLSVTYFTVELFDTSFPFMKRHCGLPINICL